MFTDTDESGVFCLDNSVRETVVIVRIIIAVVIGGSSTDESGVCKLDNIVRETVVIV